jgi:hypothetical protein
MKRKKKKFVEEFEKLDTHKNYYFQYSEEIHIELMWITTRGRWISVIDNNMIKDYSTLSSVPIPILEASIRFLNEKKEEKID